MTKCLLLTKDYDKIYCEIDGRPIVLIVKRAGEPDTAFFATASRTPKGEEVYSETSMEEVSL